MYMLLKKSNDNRAFAKSKNYVVMQSYYLIFIKVLYIMIIRNIIEV